MNRRDFAAAAGAAIVGAAALGSSSARAEEKAETAAQSRFYEIKTTSDGMNKTMTLDLFKICQIEVEAEVSGSYYSARVTTDAGYRSSFFVDDKAEVERLKQAWMAYINGLSK